MKNLNKETIRLQLLLLSARTAVGTSAILEDARKYLDFVEDRQPAKVIPDVEKTKTKEDYNPQIICQSTVNRFG